MDKELIYSYVTNSYMKRKQRIDTNLVIHCRPR